jgi:hypothetical protein
MRIPPESILTEQTYPLGSVTLAPAAMTGCSEADLARSMAEAVSEAGQRSPISALRELRDTFPDMPLYLRVKALHELMRRKA